jgi:hypothetical protein
VQIQALPFVEMHSEQIEAEHIPTPKSQNGSAFKGIGQFLEPKARRSKVMIDFFLRLTLWLCGGIAWGK